MILKSERHLGVWSGWKQGQSQRQWERVELAIEWNFCASVAQLFSLSSGNIRSDLKVQRWDRGSRIIAPSFTKKKTTTKRLLVKQFNEVIHMFHVFLVDSYQKRESIVVVRILCKSNIFKSTWLKLLHLSYVHSFIL